jgi:zinc transport system permease protein
MLAAALTTAALTSGRAKRSLPEDALLGLGFLAASAGAIVLGNRITQEAHEVSSILFGSAVVVSSADVWLLAAMFSVVVALTFVAWRGVAFAAFDPESARVQCLPVRTLDLGFWALVALTVSATTRAIGALPVFAFSVLPAMAALMTTTHLGKTLWVSGALAAGCAALGYLAAYFMALPVGATQALCCTLALGLVAVGRALGRRRTG